MEMGAVADDALRVATLVQDAGYERATAAIDQGRYGEAIELFRELIERPAVSGQATPSS